MSTLAVPFYDLARLHSEIKPELESAIAKVIDRSSLILGEDVEGFESEFAQYCGTEFCVGVGNGLDALVLILRSLGVGPGDEVLVPVNTFIATWLAVTQVGATPVPFYVDHCPSEVQLTKLSARFTNNTKALIAVHLYGVPVDLSKLLALCESNSIHLIEDAAQAHGAKFRGQPIGSWGVASAFSFYPAKNLGALGDGGAITTNSPEVKANASLLRNYGSGEKYIHHVCGANSRLDEIHAAVLRVKLNYLDGWNRRRRSIAGRYKKELANLPIFTLDEPEGSESVWHQFVVRAKDRNGLKDYLMSRKIETSIHYPIPCHLQPAYEYLGYTRGEFPDAEQTHDELLSLPIAPYLSDGECDQVISAITDWFRVNS